MGVMLALSAIFAVVLSTISMPGDRAFGQATEPDPVEVRAEAWFNTLTLDQAINALLGAEADAVEDVPGTEATIGRQYVDADDPADNDLPIEFIKAAWDAKSATKTFYDGLPADLTAEPDSGVANKDGVMALVDGDITTTGDIYAVGEQTVTSPSGVKAIRGFQSVELWWDYIDCAEARIAVGEDRVTLSTDDADDDTTGFQAATSTVCIHTLNTAGTAVESTSVKPYDELGDAKAQVDKVGQAILGLDAPGSAKSATEARAKAWWDSLTSSGIRSQALYGIGTSDPGPGAPTGGDPASVSQFWIAQNVSYDKMANPSSIRYKVTPEDPEGTEFPVDAESMARAPSALELINDRWQYIYHMGGMNDMNLDEVIYWWDSIDSTQKRIATGTDNEPEATPTAGGFSLDWDMLNPADDLTEGGKTRQADVFKFGQAILGLKKLPDVAAWWNTLTDDQKVYVVYGNPPMRTGYDEDGDPSTTEDNETTTVTDDDKAVFMKMYADLTGGIGVAEADTALSTHLPNIATATTGLLARNDFDVATASTDDKGTTDDADDTFYYSAKGIVDAIANELFDPPAMEDLVTFPHDSGTFVAASDEPENGFSNETPGAVTNADDNDFDWPYNAANKPASVADWWESTDCRVMRIAVGEDNQYLNAALAAVDADATATPPVVAKAKEDRESSIYCGHFVGSIGSDGKPRAEGSAGTLTRAAQMRVEEVGQALLGLSEPGRPSFNEPPKEDGHPLIMGTAQVGATLTVNTDPIEDEDGIPEDSDGDKVFQYQWLRNGTPISGATGSTYVLTAADAGATISVRVSFIDNERYPEMRTSPSSLATSQIVGAPGEISKIVESIRGVTISAGGDVVLSVNAYGLQGVQDNKLSAGMGLEWKEGDRSFDDDDTETPWEVTYTAPSSPGTYTITASFANDGDCRPLDKDGGEEMRDTLCTATFQVRVRRDQPPVATPAPPVNPPGEIPGLIPDSDGNQYEVFTPVEGGTFDGGEGYSITVPSGAVPNGEYIGIRMSDDGAASNVGQIHQRYTLAGNMYGVHAVDASGAAISSYVLEAPAEVCVPLPAALRTNISHLSLAAINSDGTLTVLSAQVRLNGTGGDTMVCGNLSNLPASVAVGSQGAPAAPPTATPEPTPDLPDTGGTSPASGGLVWALLLGTAVVASGTFIVAGRRRKTVGSK